MTQPPEPSTYGQISEFLREVHRDLVKSGCSPLDLSARSLRRALLARYGSPERVDQAIEIGAYWEIQQSSGGRSSWRKAWVRVRKEEMDRFLVRVQRLGALAEAIDQCREAGIPDDEILGEVQKALDGGRVTALEPMPSLPAAQ